MYQVGHTDYFNEYLLQLIIPITTRLSQLDLKLQLDSLAVELKRLSLAQHEYLFASTLISSPQSPVSDDKTTTSSTAAPSAKIAIDTCTLLDGYARRLCGARTKIAVVGNILESTQVQY